LINVNTNAILPTQTVKTIGAVASHCRGAKILASLSLDGVGKLHDEIRGVPGNFEAVLECHRRLMELKQRLPNLCVVLQSTVSRHNLHHTAELMEFCQKHGDAHILTFAQESELYRNHGDGHDVTTDCVAVPQIIDELAERFTIRAARDLLQWCHIRLTRHFVERRTAPVPCTAGSSTVTLGPTGEVSGCLFLDNSMGRAKDSGYNLMTLLHTDRARSVQKACSACHQCWINCESFPSMMSSPFKTALRALDPGPQHVPVVQGAPDAPR